MYNDIPNYPLLTSPPLILLTLPTLIYTAQLSLKLFDQNKLCSCIQIRKINRKIGKVRCIFFNVSFRSLYFFLILYSFICPQNRTNDTNADIWRKCWLFEHGGFRQRNTNLHLVKEHTHAAPPLEHNAWTKPSKKKWSS